jgi:hypothetical protein
MGGGESTAITETYWTSGRAPSPPPSLLMILYQKVAGFIGPYGYTYMRDRETDDALN